jgi:GMP synthase-like glutamine amidotransferase
MSLMKPIAVFQHSRLVGPGHFANFLNARKRIWQLIRIDLGDAVPQSCEAFSGLCFLGGEMSVNDPLPWIEAELELIREAVARDIPVIGHCLGGQLMSKALGGKVGPNSVREIGWGRVSVTDSSTAREWLGDLGEFDSFHWHGETFTLPTGAQALLSSRFCGNQAFVLGPHLGMQCHVEMTRELISDWADEWANETAALDVPQESVQSANAMLAEIDAKLPAMQHATERLYERWLSHVLRRVQAD